ncbi:hypothetical protein V3W47_14105 [Deinococcus sp. YIM 134068]|uniref:hypothetical protein n=1 Tax=Deinococcus lichenicola TaxID=3118910 RepID=UPI002F951949
MRWSSRRGDHDREVSGGHPGVQHPRPDLGGQAGVGLEGRDIQDALPPQALVRAVARLDAGAAEQEGEVLGAHLLAVLLNPPHGGPSLV